MQASLDPTLLLIIAIPTILLFSWTVWQQITISQIKKRQNMIFKGKGKIDLEEIILQCEKKSKSTDAEIKNLYAISKQINALARKGLHKFSVVRFNPFRDIGGDQSFSVAMLDDENSGVVISSLYSRDGVRVYAKSIRRGQCEKHQLTEEEYHAIASASGKKQDQRA